jgi:hypothetical protein
MPGQGFGAPGGISKPELIDKIAFPLAADEGAAFARPALELTGGADADATAVVAGRELPAPAEEEAEVAVFAPVCCALSAS